MVYTQVQISFDINFQDEGTTTPSGWLGDYGQQYGDRGSGYYYGWNCNYPIDGRNRAVSGYNDLDNTLMHFDRDGACADTAWELLVANGRYLVSIIYLDTKHQGSTAGCMLEGQSISCGSGSYSIGISCVKTLEVTVSDSKLTMSGERNGSPQCSTVNRIKTQPPPPDAQLEMYYSFDADFGTLVHDLSGHFRNGITYGAAWRPEYSAGAALPYGKSLHLNQPSQELDILSQLDLTSAYTTSSYSKFQAAALGTAYSHLTVDFFFAVEKLTIADGEALLNFAAVDSFIGTGDPDGLALWGAAAELHLDGTLRATIATATSSLRVCGRRPVFNAHWWQQGRRSSARLQMKLDEVRVYGAAAVPPPPLPAPPISIFSSAGFVCSFMCSNAAAGTVYWRRVLARGSFGTEDDSAMTIQTLLEASPTGIVRRLCDGCSTSHRELYYKRLTDASTITAYDLLAGTWNSTNNVLNQDFELYSSYSAATARTDRWRSCSYNTAGVGFPGECGQTEAVAGQWSLWGATGDSAGQADVAFEIEPSCMDLIAPYCKTYASSDTGCQTFSGRKQVPKVGTEVMIEVDGLTSETTYTVHLVAEDNRTPPNWQEEPTRLRASTLDITPPQLEVLGTVNIQVVQGATYIDLGARAYDTNDRDISQWVKAESSVDTSRIGLYRVTYTAMQKIGPRGGLMPSADMPKLGGRYARLSFPPNAVKSSEEYAVRELESAEVAGSNELGSSSRLRSAKSSYLALTPHGSTFDEPVTVEIPYYANTSGSLAVSAMVAAAGAPGTWCEIDSISSGVVRIASVTHFSWDAYAAALLFREHLDQSTRSIFTGDYWEQFGVGYALEISDTERVDAADIPPPPPAPPPGGVYLLQSTLRFADVEVTEMLPGSALRLSRYSELTVEWRRYCAAMEFSSQLQGPLRFRLSKNHRHKNKRAHSPVEFPWTSTQEAEQFEQLLVNNTRLVFQQSADGGDEPYWDQFSTVESVAEACGSAKAADVGMVSSNSSETDPTTTIVRYEVRVSRNTADTARSALLEESADGSLLQRLQEHGLGEVIRLETSDVETSEEVQAGAVAVHAGGEGAVKGAVECPDNERSEVVNIEDTASETVHSVFVVAVRHIWQTVGQDAATVMLEVTTLDVTAPSWWSSTSVADDGTEVPRVEAATATSLVVAVAVASEVHFDWDDTGVASTFQAALVSNISEIFVANDGSNGTSSFWTQAGPGPVEVKAARLWAVALMGVGRVRRRGSTSDEGACQHALAQYSR
eukprot:gene13015-15376_t